MEGYPIDPKGDRMLGVFVYTGLASTFQKAGFVEVTRRSEKRPIMRYIIENGNHLIILHPESVALFRLDA